MMLSFACSVCWSSAEVLSSIDLICACCNLSVSALSDLKKGWLHVKQVHAQWKLDLRMSVSFSNPMKRIASMVTYTYLHDICTYMYVLQLESFQQLQQQQQQTNKQNLI